MPGAWIWTDQRARPALPASARSVRCSAARLLGGADGARGGPTPSIVRYFAGQRARARGARTRFICAHLTARCCRRRRRTAKRQPNNRSGANGRCVMYNFCEPRTTRAGSDGPYSPFGAFARPARSGGKQSGFVSIKSNRIYAETYTHASERAA